LNIYFNKRNENMGINAANNNPSRWKACETIAAEGQGKFTGPGQMLHRRGLFVLGGSRKRLNEKWIYP
jgi:hypothetical protein